MSTILLTGATGFLGGHLLPALLRTGHSVVIAKRQRSNCWRIEDCLKKIAVYNVEETPVEQMFEDHQVDSVVHLATMYRKIDDAQATAAMLDANIVFPAKLLEACKNRNVKSFINTGTFFEYDCSRQPVSEKEEKRALNYYAKTKLVFEELLQTYQSHMSIVTLKLFSPYGPADNEKIVPMILDSALKNKEIWLSDGMQKLDFTYSEDIVQAYLAALRYIETLGPAYEVFNIGSGSPTSIRELVSVVEQQVGRAMNKHWGKPSDFDLPIAYADIRRAKEKLGWYPAHDIHLGIEKTLKYYREVVGYGNS